MKMSYAPTYHTNAKSGLASLIDGETHVDQKYYLIPFWIRDIFRDNGLHYKGMIDPEIVSKYVSLQDTILADNTCWVISSMIDFFTSKNSLFNENIMGNKVSNTPYYPLKDIWKQSCQIIDGKQTSTITPFEYRLIRTKYAMNANETSYFKIPYNEIYDSIYVDNTSSFTAYDIFKMNKDSQNKQSQLSQKISQTFTEIFSRFINGYDLSESDVNQNSDCGIYEAYTKKHNRNYIALADTNSIQDKGYSLYRINNDTTFIFIEESFFVPIIVQWLKTAREIVDFQFGTSPKYSSVDYKNKNAAYTALLSPNSIYSELEEKRVINDNSNICLLGAVLPYGLDGRILSGSNNNNSQDKPTIKYIPSTDIANKYFQVVTSYFYNLNKEVISDAYSYESMTALARKNEFINFISGI